MPTPTSPAEPVLDVHDIQGNVFPGFNKDHQIFVFLSIVDAAAAKRWLAAIADQISTVDEVLTFNRLFKKMRARRRGHESSGLVATWNNIAFTWPGLRKLTNDAELFDKESAFRIGAAARSQLLGDSPDPADESNPAKWIVGGPGNDIDVMVTVASDDRDRMLDKAKRMADDAEACGLKVIAREEGAVRSDPGMRGHEHFGFDDNVSQPGVRGRASNDAADFITAREVDPSDPQAAYMSRPGQFLLWPGEFVVGYPQQNSRDPLLAGSIAQLPPQWTRNGAFVVFRRLRQDVKMFWTFLRDEAARIANEPGFAGMTDVRLGALFVGRWKSGAPLVRTPNADNQALGDDDLAANNFNLGADSRAIKVNGYTDPFPQATQDPIGMTCPVAAHIRKVNPRDQSSEMGSAADTLTRRVMRRGIPFGAPLPDPFANDPENGNRGLLWISYQTSIERQFEFLAAGWMNRIDRPRTPEGHDMLLGQRPVDGNNGARRCTLFSGLEHSTSVETSKAWIVATGGAYLFAPSISAIKNVLSA